MDGKDIHHAMYLLRKKASSDTLAPVMWEMDIVTHSDLADYLTWGESKRTGAKLTNVFGIPISIGKRGHSQFHVLHCEDRVLE